MLFRVLGPLEVHWPDRRAVDLTTGNQRLLTVLLARANTWVDAETVVGALWPDGPPPAAHGNARVAVHRLRELLPRAMDGSPRINSRPSGYRLNVQRAELDAAAFEDLVRQGRAALAAPEPAAAVSLLVQALRLWDGEPYGPFGAQLAGQEVARLRALRDEALDAFQDACQAKAAMAAQAAGEQGTDPAAMAGHAGPGRPDPDAEPDRPGPDRPGPDGSPDAQRATEQNSERNSEQDAERTVVLHPRLGRSRWPSAGARIDRSGRAPVVVPLAVLVVLVVLAVGAFAGVTALTSRDDRLLGVAAPAASAPTGGQPPAGPGGSSSPEPTSAPPVAPRRPVPGLPASAATSPNLLFGMGDRADTASRTKLVAAAPVRMLTTRYQGPADLPRLLPWRTGVVRDAYAGGFALHLIIAGWDRPAPLETRYGPSCGRPAPLTDGFLDQMRKLAATFAGGAASPPLFVTVFEDVHSYGCNRAGFRADQPTAAYYEALRDRYVVVRQIFHRAAPNALVSIGWSGRQASGDNPATGGGASMFKYFAPVLRWSDFQSFRAVHTEANVEDVRAMVRALGQYGPVMLSSYGPANRSSAVFDADVRALLTKERLGELTRGGLFAWSFQPDALAAASPATAAFVTDVVRRYGRPAG